MPKTVGAAAADPALVTAAVLGAVAEVSHRLPPVPEAKTNLSSLISRFGFGGVVFDLDGVITESSELHRAAWIDSFNKTLPVLRDLLRPGASISSDLSAFLAAADLQVFEEKDYLDHVNGKPRVQGIRDFLTVRGLVPNTVPLVDEIVQALRSSKEKLLHPVKGEDPIIQPEALAKLKLGPVDLAVMDLVSVIGLGKNRLFNEMLDKLTDDKFEKMIYPDTINFMRELKNNGLRYGIASSSKNARKILDRISGDGKHPPVEWARDVILGLAETAVEGYESERLGLAGKPAPDIFLEQCRRLGVTPARAIVVEDAVSGVQAGRAGNFGLTLALARKKDQAELALHGADFVLINGIGQLGSHPLKPLQKWFQVNLPMSLRGLRYRGQPQDQLPKGVTREKVQQERQKRESLMTQGNGVFCTRAAHPESKVIGTDPNQSSYAGTFMHRVKNELVSVLDPSDRRSRVSNEDIVNVINWLPSNFRIVGGKWFNPDTDCVANRQDRLNHEDGLLTRELVVRDARGRETAVRMQRVVSMAHPDLAAQRMVYRPLNYSGDLELRLGLHADHKNDGVAGYRKFNQQHLQSIAEGADSEGTSWIRVKTTNSNIEIAAFAKSRVALAGEEIKPEFTEHCSESRVDTTFKIPVKKGQALVVEKIVGLRSSRDPAKGSPLDLAEATVSQVRDFDEVYQASAEAWRKLHAEGDITLLGDRLAQQVLNHATYHGFIAHSPHTIGRGVGIGYPRELTGEKYRNNVFWDEMMIAAPFILQSPEMVRDALMFRYNTLDVCRAYARETTVWYDEDRPAGEQRKLKGALIPHQTGDDGREQTQRMRLNPVSNQFDADNTFRQRHVSLAVMANVVKYFRATNDVAFMEKYGAELALEICRCWASMCRENNGRYDIGGVVGPNEYHEGKTKKGVLNNSYTNVMAAWAFDQAEHIISSLSPDAYQNLCAKIDFKPEELTTWGKIKQGLNLPIQDGILGNHADWFSLQAELPSIEKKHRWDQTLRAISYDPDDFRIAKQGDTMQLYANLGAAEVKRLVKMMTGVELPPDHLELNFAHHDRHTTHESTLSFSCHTNALVQLGRLAESVQRLEEVKNADLLDVQGGTTAEGIHSAVTQGMKSLVMETYGGVNLWGERPILNPKLPEGWEEIKFSFCYHGQRFSYQVTPGMLSLDTSQMQEAKKITFYVGADALPVTVERRDEPYELPLSPTQ